MTDVPPSVRQSRLRPLAGRFDLRMNKNKFGLMRRTIKRETESTKAKPTNESKRKILQIIKNDIKKEHDNDPNNNNEEEANVKMQPVPIFAVKTREVPKPAYQTQWIKPKQQVKQKQPPLYNQSKPAEFKKLTEASLFEIFNQLTLNELCNTAGACNELKLAAQKYFEVMYTTLNMAWLIDDGDDKFTLLQAQRLLQCFGNFISTLIVNTDQLKEADEKEKLLEMIGQHCAGVVFWDSK